MTTLKLAKTLLTKLPDKFTYLEGSLDLTDSSIEVLPQDMTIKGDLIIGNSPIKELPNNLMVLGNLDLTNSTITFIPNTVYIGGNIIADQAINYNFIQLPIYTITDKIIVFSNGENYPYYDKLTIGERADHYERWVHYVDKYFLFNGDFIYVFQNKYFLYRRKDESEQDIIFLIERMKRDDRIKNKYNALTLQSCFNLKEFFQIYQDFTDTCELALIELQDIATKYFPNLDLQQSYPLSLWIQGCKMSDYKYNYLFLEWCEQNLQEEAN